MTLQEKIKKCYVIYKTRDFVNNDILKSICFALFDNHINYASII